MDSGEVLEAMRAELEAMRHEKICMELRLKAMEKEAENNKRLIAEYKVIQELADELLREIVFEAGSDNLDEKNGVDEETMNSLVEEALRDFTEALNEAKSLQSHPVDGGDGGRNGTNGVKEARRDGCANDGAGGHA